MRKTITTGLCLMLWLMAAWPARAQQRYQASVSGPLYEQLLHADSLLFHIALGSCDSQALQALFTKDFVFYHDNGLENPTMAQPLADFITSAARLCKQQQAGTRLRRQIVPGSLQAFTVNSQEAMQTGVQQFYLSQPGQPEKQVEVSRFSRTWKKEGNTWKLARELDYDVNTHFAEAAAEQRYQPAPYVPDNKALYDTIVNLDSTFFNAYNTCNMDKMTDMMVNNLEFYHDRGGLTTSRAEVLAATQKNICGKVKRELIKGSIEVYPINGYGAVEIGYHRFHNLAEGATSHGSKFIILWQRNNNHWQMCRVISLH
ncbi:MAG TPA: nuclear transport factor 2 family protein [Chitinophaga sp.]|uniref:nuclear transport factor 2 family protein n=1 Tax=Chitinophaga sp. TaxID=1869181 RepID=UPI002DBC1855|nr:nuclear transport factor 2 family protein [Chitinophaga sp.]HEU4552895.1 nuclear transport factor 2 family protein [Chitinophaga sp.]